MMGYDARCTLVIDGTSRHGTACLEDRQLIFRGPIRLAIPLEAVSSATASGGTLLVRFDGRSAEFQIGAAAERWADRITRPPSRLDKLGVKPGQTVAVLGAIEAPFALELEGRGARVVRRGPSPSRPVDLVFLAASRRDALDRLRPLSQAINPAGAVWVVRPRGSSAITESETMAAGKRAGLVDVKVVRFSETHTAEKFVIPVAARQSRAPGLATPSRRRRDGAGRARSR
ncbi:MAG TPA: hypothetical protein VLD67_03350 [Vicinamibacterales bacterium]|nr:hypothetical protein [Vicinamibacterales bacterium]